MRYGKFQLLVLCAGLAVLRGQQAGKPVTAKPAPPKKAPGLSCPEIPRDMLPVSSSKGIARNFLDEMVYLGTVKDSEGVEHYAILTTKGRVVVSEGDEIDGKVIVFIPPDTDLAINLSGQVVWMAGYAYPQAGRTVDAGDTNGFGIFCERKFVSNLIYDAGGNFTRFALADDGTITLKIPEAALKP